MVVTVVIWVTQVLLGYWFGICAASLQLLQQIVVANPVEARTTVFIIKTSIV